MAVIQVNKFSGVSPMTPPRYLGNEAAQTAINCPVWMGSLQPISGALALNPSPLTKSGNLKSIYRYDQTQTNQLNYWFHWTTDVDVVQGFIAGDTTERTYFTGDGVPKVTNTALALTGGGNLYPIAAYNLGVPKPTSALVTAKVNAALTGSINPTASVNVVGVGTKFTTELIVGNSILVSGEGRVVATITDDTHLTVTAAFTDVANDTSPVRIPDAENTVAETRVYTYTHVNSFEEESAPFAATDMALSTEDVYPGESVVVTLPTASITNYNVTKKRIYRSAQGSGSSAFLFVGEVALAASSFTDTLDGDELNEVLPSLTWSHPPSTLKGLVGMPNGVMAGFSGNDVYFSEPFRPFAWPTQYVQTVGYPIVGLGVIDTTLVVLTQGRPYFIQGSHPSSSTMVESDINQACLSKRSIVSMGNAVFYASPDGLVALSPGGSAVVTESMFDKFSWQATSPADLLGCAYENKYVGFYNVSSGIGGFIYDMVAQTWNFHTVYATGAYNDLKTDSLYIIQSNELSKWDSGALLTYTWKSKKWSYPEPKSFACYRVQAEAYPVTTKIFRDGTEIVSISVTDDKLRRLPAGLGTSWEFQLQGTKEVYNVQLAQSPQELNQG